MAESQAQVVYSHVAEGSSLRGQLFEGKKFWVAQRCPARGHYVDQIKSNGGLVVPLEKQADYLIVDHVRKDLPPGSISYRFIENSIKNGELEDPDNHIAGPGRGTVRDIGSLRPTKRGRVAFTAQDDADLYRWVKDYEKNGGYTSGNEIYKQLEQKNPRHTWQSWRDRWVRRLQDKPPSTLPPANAPPSPPSDRSVEQPAQSRTQTNRSSSVPATRHEHDHVSKTEGGKQKAQVQGKEAQQLKRVKFTQSEFEELYANVDTIANSTFHDYLEGWQHWAQGTPQSAEQWQEYFEKTVYRRWKEDSQEERNRIAQIVHKRHEEEALGEDANQEAESSRSPTTPKRGGRGKERAVPSEEAIGSLSPQRMRVPPSTISLDQRRTSKVRSESPNALLERLIMKLVEEREGEKPIEAYKFWAEEQKPTLREEQPQLDYVGVHKVLVPRWNALSTDEQAPYKVMELADRTRYEMESEGIQQSSTQDAIWTIAELQEKSKKRRRDENDSVGLTQSTEQSALSLKSKRARAESPLFVREGTQEAGSADSMDMEEVEAPDQSQRIDQFAHGLSGSASNGRVETLVMGSTPIASSILKRSGPFIGSQESEVSEVIEDIVDDLGHEEVHNGSKRTDTYTIVITDDEREDDENDLDEEGKAGYNLTESQTGLTEHDLPSSMVDREEDMERYIQDELQAQGFFPQISQYEEEQDEPLYPDLTQASATPTPRGPRHKDAAFDTQAILSSPSQPLDLLLALPQYVSSRESSPSQQSQRSPRPSSPARKQESISTSQSLREFRRALDDTPSSPQLDTAVPKPTPANVDPDASDTETASQASSTTSQSTDPDPPLAGAGVRAFFAAYTAQGFPHARLVAALKHTTLRPELAKTVLEAWSQDEELPNQRGIWSETEDEWLEGGDAGNIRRLHLKHGWEGWGGCVERMGFLDKARRHGGGR